jgi:hypothetical protein
MLWFGSLIMIRVVLSGGPPALRSGLTGNTSSLLLFHDRHLPWSRFPNMPWWTGGDWAPARRGARPWRSAVPASSQRPFLIFLPKYKLLFWPHPALLHDRAPLCSPALLLCSSRCCLSLMLIPAMARLSPLFLRRRGFPAPSSRPSSLAVELLSAHTPCSSARPPSHGTPYVHSRAASRTLLPGSPCAQALCFLLPPCSLFRSSPSMFGVCRDAVPAFCVQRENFASSHCRWCHAGLGLGSAQLVELLCTLPIFHGARPRKAFLSHGASSSLFPVTLASVAAA